MRILSKETDKITVITASGVTLVCVPVRKLPVQDLLFKIGLSEKAMKSNDPNEIAASLQSGGKDKQMQSAKASMALFNYCMAYGVVTNPPAVDLEELQSLGLAPNTTAAKRSTWLNYLVLEDASEAGLLTSIILTLTFRGEDIANVIPETKTE